LPDTGPDIPQEAALQPANHQACQNTPSETKALATILTEWRNRGTAVGRKSSRYVSRIRRPKTILIHQYTTLEVRKHSAGDAKRKHQGIYY
jgi:hypothetical protein